MLLQIHGTVLNLFLERVNHMINVIRNVVGNVLVIYQRFYLLVTHRNQLTARGSHPTQQYSGLPLPIRCTCRSGNRACWDA
jgi:hypothetical protein